MFRGRAWLGAVITSGVLVAATIATPAHADEPVAPEVEMNPSRYPPEGVPRKIVLVGAAVTAGWYGAAVATSFGWSKSDGASSLRIPVAGPYLALAKTGCGSKEPSCSTLGVIVRTVLTSLSAVGQTGGLLAIVEGLLVPTTPSGDTARRALPARRSAYSVVPTPIGPDGLGVGVVGDF